MGRTLRSLSDAGSLSLPPTAGRHLFLLLFGLSLLSTVLQGQFERDDQYCEHQQPTQSQIPRHDVADVATRLAQPIQKFPCLPADDAVTDAPFRGPRPAAGGVVRPLAHLITLRPQNRTGMAPAKG